MSNHVTAVVWSWWNGRSVGIGLVSSSETSRSPSAPVVESPSSAMSAYVGMFNDHRGVHSSWHGCNDLPHHGTSTNSYSMHDKRDPLIHYTVISPLWHNNQFCLFLFSFFSKKLEALSASIFTDYWERIDYNVSSIDAIAQRSNGTHRLTWLFNKTVRYQRAQNLYASCNMPACRDTLLLGRGNFLSRPDIIHVYQHDRKENPYPDY